MGLPHFFSEKKTAKNTKPCFELVVNSILECSDNYFIFGRISEKHNDCTEYKPDDIVRINLIKIIKYSHSNSKFVLESSTGLMHLTKFAKDRDEQLLLGILNKLKIKTTNCCL